MFDINDPKDPIGRDPEAITNWVKVVGKEPRCRTAVITIDLEAKPKKADIKARFDEWLDKNYHGAPRGKAGKGSKTIPWHKLRDLAALRLNEAGFKYPDAQKFLSAEMKNRKGKPISNGTWPIYRNDNRGTENPGGWSNALKRARDEIAKVADRIKLLP
ncbi:MAG TPA: hypothetical protein PLX89_07650 [Verrucomicrobiota bacterium]|nr:hypothetical protein [Verrucomicrobiota bacterium]